MRGEVGRGGGEKSKALPKPCGAGLKITPAGQQCPAKMIIIRIILQINRINPFFAQEYHYFAQEFINADDVIKR